MTDLPTDILKAAQSITTEISKRLPESPSLGFATQLIAEGMEARDALLREAIGLLEQASAQLWTAQRNSHAREIDRFLDRVSPESNEKITAAIRREEQ